jgi:hypothetical protein
MLQCDGTLTSNRGGAKWKSPLRLLHHCDLACGLANAQIDALNHKFPLQGSSHPMTLAMTLAVRNAGKTHLSKQVHKMT